jgi:ubiquinone biosynthesis protein
MSVVTRHLLAQFLTPVLARRPRLARLFPITPMPKPERLRTAIEDIGGTFIKFGQMLALQPDILPFEYCRALADLLDRVAPFPWAQVRQTFIEELGQEPERIFDGFEPEPIATASIGQVHVAYLKGRKMAVKVQRPNVRIDFAGDIRLMSGAIALIKRLRLRPLAWMIEPMSEFVAWTREELDFTCEGRYMQQLRANSQESTSERVPEVVWEYTSCRVLVLEFFEGTTVLNYLRALEGDDQLTLRRLEKRHFEPKRFARNIIDNFLGDVFRYGMFHADLHPANLMILENNTVGYVDFGITGVLSHYSRQKLVAMTLAYTRADIDAMCEAFYKVSVMDAHSDVAGFRRQIGRFSEEWYAFEGGTYHLRKNFTLVMLDMLRLSRQTGIWPERDVIKYIRSAIAIDGLITRFAPGFNVGAYLEEVCDRYLKWEARRSLLSYDSFLDWSDSGMLLLRDGPHRVTQFLSQLALGEVSLRATRDGGAGRVVERQQALYLAATVLGLSSIAVLGEFKTSLGVNLFTAATLIASAAAFLLVRTLLRLMRVE